jgi:ABC-2 type transport system permease protein
VRDLTYTLRALPALLRIGTLEAIAYRAEFLVWMLSTTMPFVMWSLLRVVALEGPLTGAGARYDSDGFARYYLLTLLVRQVTGSWVVWELVRAVREGTLSLRLLRPVSPLVALGAEALASVPLRAIIATPVMVIGIWLADIRLLGCDAAHGLLAAVALVGAWLLNFSASALVGTLALYLESTISIWQLWLGLFMLLSGYLLPLELFPPWLAHLAALTPFPSLQALPVELLAGLRTGHEATRGLATQWAYVALLLGLLVAGWRYGLRRFGAAGG